MTSERPDLLVATALLDKIVAGAPLDEASLGIEVQRDAEGRPTAVSLTVTVRAIYNLVRLLIERTARVEGVPVEAVIFDVRRALFEETQ